MIDIHNHIIFEFDDGPRTIDESLEMLKIAADQGIRVVFATSHFDELIHAELEKDYFRKLDRLREKARESAVDINLYSGSELFFHHFMNETVKSNKVTTLGGQGSYVLMEFSLYFMPQGPEDALFNLNMDGYHPIIAHPERYGKIIENPLMVLKFIKHGGLLQVNAGSILGSFGKRVQKTAMWMLERRLVHFIASDAHAPEGRSFKLAKCVEFLKGHLDEEYIREMVEVYPGKIIANEPLEKMTIPEAVIDQENGFLHKFRSKLKFI